MERSFLQILSSEGIIGAIVDTPYLLFMVVTILLFTVVAYFVLKKMVEPLLSKRDAQDVAKALNSMSMIISDMTSSVKQLKNTLSIMYQSFKGSSISLELLIWLIREVASLYPALLVGNIIAVHRSGNHIDRNDILLAVEMTLRDMNAFFSSVPDSPFFGAEKPLEEMLNKVKQGFMEDYMCAIEGSNKGIKERSDGFVLLDELSTIHSTAHKHVGAIVDYLHTVLSVANFGQD